MGNGFDSHLMDLMLAKQRPRQRDAKSGRALFAAEESLICATACSASEVFGQPTSFDTIKIREDKSDG